MAGKVLDLVGVDSGFLKRWGDGASSRASADQLSPEPRAAMFDRIAGPYDRMNRVDDRRPRSPLARARRRRGGVGLGAKVVDVCCGTGDLALELARRVGRRGEVTGVDFSENMLRSPARKAARLDHRERPVRARRRARPADRRRRGGRRHDRVRHAQPAPTTSRASASWCASCGRAGVSSASRSRRPRGALGGFYRVWFDRGCRRSARSSTAATRRTRTCPPRCAASRARRARRDHVRRRPEATSATACSPAASSRCTSAR